MVIQCEQFSVFKFEIPHSGSEPLSIVIIRNLLVKLEIITTVQKTEQVVRPAIVSYTLTFKAQSPEGTNITWYMDDKMIDERVLTIYDDMGGTSILEVSRRVHSGRYHMVVKSLFGDHEVPEDILTQCTDEYSFNVNFVGEYNYIYKITELGDIVILHIYIYIYIYIYPS